MQFESHTLAEPPFSFDIRWPFPVEDRGLLEDALRAVTVSEPSQVETLESQLNSHLSPHGYLWCEEQAERCRLWRPDFNHSVDFLHEDKRIAIEVEKTEKKRIVHDVLKLVNGSLTFSPRVRYGVLVYPRYYKRSSGKESTFASTVVSDISFY